MKTVLLIVPVILLLIACDRGKSNEETKNEILQAEKAFERMTFEKGIAEAFYHFADENAVIKRENDTLITGKENIKIYYAKKNLTHSSVTWTPDFIGVSDGGTLGYTYGKYVWKTRKSDGSIVENKGVFHTVWKKQKDKNWRYVWD